MNDITTINNQDNLASYLEQKFPYEEDNIEKLTSNILEVLEEAYRRFGEQHALSITQLHDGSIGCSFARIDPLNESTSQIHSAGIQNHEGYNLDMRKVGRLSVELNFETLYEEFEHPHSSDNIKLASEYDVDNETNFYVHLAGMTIESLEQNAEYKLPIALRGRVLTDDYPFLSEHHIYLNEGDIVHLAMPIQNANSAQSFSHNPVPSIREPEFFDGDEKYVYYPYEIYGIEEGKIIVIPKNIKLEQLRAAGEKVSQELDYSTLLGHIMSGKLTPPNRDEQKTSS